MDPGTAGGSESRFSDGPFSVTCAPISMIRSFVKFWTSLGVPPVMQDHPGALRSRLGAPGPSGHNVSTQRNKTTAALTRGIDRASHIGFIIRKSNCFEVGHLQFDLSYSKTIYNGSLPAEVGRPPVRFLL